MAFKVFQTIQKAAIAGRMTRRTFVNWWGLGWALFAAASGACVTAMGRYLMPNVLFEPPLSFKAGFPAEYQIGAVDTRWKARYGVWVVREDAGLYVLSTVCTHLGCTPNWQAADSKFKCPCHGSGFYITGVNFEGPAPRPLERHKIGLADDGQILIDKSKLFQQEKGQWTDPEAFLKYTG